MHDVHGQILEKKNVPRRSGFDKSSAVRWQQLCKTWNHQTAKGKSWANEEFPKRGTYTIKMVVIFGNLNHTAFSKNNGYPIKKIKTVTLLEVGPIRVTSPNSHAGCTNRTPFKFRSPEYIFRKKKNKSPKNTPLKRKILQVKVLMHHGFVPPFTLDAINCLLASLVRSGFCFARISI